MDYCKAVLPPPIPPHVHHLLTSPSCAMLSLSFCRLNKPGLSNLGEGQLVGELGVEFEPALKWSRRRSSTVCDTPGQDPLKGSLTCKAAQSLVLREGLIFSVVSAFAVLKFVTICL